MSAALVNYSRDEAILRADELYHQINRYPVHEHRYLVHHVERDDFAKVVGPQLIECLCGAILLELGCTRVGTTIRVNSTHAEQRADSYAPKIDEIAYLMVAFVLLRALLDADLLSCDLGSPLVDAYCDTIDERDGYPRRVAVERCYEDAVRWLHRTRPGTQERATARALLSIVDCLSDGGNLHDLGRSVRLAKAALLFERTEGAECHWQDVLDQAYVAWCEGLTVSLERDSRALFGRVTFL